MSPRGGLVLRIRAQNSLSGRVELRDGHTVVDEEGGFGDAHSTEPELHAHGEVVCKGGDGQA